MRTRLCVNHKVNLSAGKITSDHKNGFSIWETVKFMHAQELVCFAVVAADAKCFGGGMLIAVVQIAVTEPKDGGSIFGNQSGNQLSCSLGHFG
ncbi:hypothetical protein [Victivallis vadensis]|uniref:hypothetical protein n=1 Tax=Victivallis vadensis TaxID=172901 RepID=UPI0026DAED98|nr:hypothetical protein [Victivallis vadensis]